MRLKDTVSFFSTETFADVFDSTITFVGKVNPFAEISNSGASSQRRILETPTTESIPQARVIQSPSSETFIVAAANHDFWKGEVIRYKYPILPVDHMGSVGDVGEMLADSPADSSVYCYPYFVRREIDETERSDFLSGFELYFSQVKSFARGDILELDGSYYRFQNDTWIDGAGFAMVQAIKLENPLQVLDLTIDRADYNPVTDSMPGTAAAAKTCFVEPLKTNYEFVTPSFTDVEAGDKAISILKASATVGVNTIIGNYKVLAIRDLGVYVTCQCRRLT